MRGFVLSLRIMGYAHHKKSEKIILQVCDQYAKRFSDKEARLFNNGLVKGMNLRIHCKDLSDVSWKFTDLHDHLLEVLEDNLKGETECNKITMPEIRISLFKNTMFGGK